MSIYSYLKYQDAIDMALAEKRKRPEKWALRQMAEAVGIQPSFLTNVLKRRVEFSSDQLFAVACYLGFNFQERRYLALLLEHQRSSHRVRKSELKAEIDQIRSDQQKTERHISIKAVELSTEALAEYYLDPFVQLVHVYLNISSYSDEPEKLCRILGISKAHLLKILAILERIGYAINVAGRIEVITRNKHLPKDAPLCGPHQALMRMKAIDQLQRLAPEDRYSVSATLTGTPETRAELQEAFLSFMKQAELIVKSAGSSDVYQMNFDLFPWHAKEKE